MLNFKDLLNLKDITGQAKRLLDVFLNEPLAYRIPAEKGWKAVMFVPKPDSEDDIIIDIIDFNEWGFFTSLRFPDQTDKEYNDSRMLRKNCEATNPIIPDDYDGPLSFYFESIKKEYPNWNRIVPPSLVFGCLSPNDNKSKKEVEKVCRDMYSRIKESLSKIEEVQKGMGTDMSSVLDGIFSTSNDKSKLN